MVAGAVVSDLGVPCKDGPPQRMQTWRASACPAHLRISLRIHHHGFELLARLGQSPGFVGSCQQGAPFMPARMRDGPGHCPREVVGALTRAAREPPD
jgi:hypothetical protein